MQQMPPQGRIRIRRARTSDAAALASLATQLGYPATRAQALQRFLRLARSPRDAVFVAESVAREVIGWGHVSANLLLESGKRAELNALIVAEGSRSAGAGKLLLQRAERWARGRGCSILNLRSNVLRERAHKFYLRNGYEHYKTQKAFRKRLR
ncbi:MAG TPA: GNAT family N-acetyltransferase [Methylomirabilota bacterium]|nr:GNAT family N-acetyltransferase [Methylomirabilota bacterium]